MRRSIFKQSDYKLVNLPVPKAADIPIGQYPDTDYPYAPVHQGVAYVEGGFKGSKIWCSNSPYPGADIWENPMVWRSVDDKFPATQFIGYDKNPIRDALRTAESQAAGDLSFNSDPDILIAKNELLVVNREFYRGSGITSDVRAVMYKGIFTGNTLSDFTEGIKLYNGYGTAYTGTTVSVVGSQAMHYDSVNDKYVMFDVCSGSWNSATAECLAIRKSETDTLGEDCFTEWTHIAFHGYKLECWHMSVFPHGGKLYSIVSATVRGYNGADSGRIYLGEFNEDLTALYLYGRALTDFRAYRSDAFVDENGLFVLYANSYGYTFDGGTGQTGKDVFVTSRPFAEVLEQVRR